MSRVRAVALAAIALAALAACGSDKHAAVSSATPVSVTPVRVVELAERIEASGELMAKEEAAIAAEVDGRVTELLTEEGSAVAEGEPMLEIDPERRRLELDAARAGVDEARAALSRERREHVRIKELRQRKVASQTQLDEANTALALAQSRLAAAEAQLGVAERALRNATVVAPFAGLVAERSVSRGEFVTPGQQLFQLVSLDPILVEFRLAEVDSGRVRIGQLVDVRVDPHPNETFQAAVSIVSPTIDPRTRTLRVKGEMRNADARLRPGLFARVDLGVATRSGVRLVPEEAVLQRADGSIVFRLGADNRVERIVVETGVHRDGSIEIVRGVGEGDRIVSRGNASLVDGQRVEPRRLDGRPMHPATPNVASEGRGEAG